MFRTIAAEAGERRVGWGRWTPRAAILAGAAVLAGGLAGAVPAPAAAQPPTYPVQTTLPFSGLANPLSVALDAAGNVYASGIGSEVAELPAGAASSKQQKVLPFTGLRNAAGIAVDAAGDVYLADRFNHRVVELPAGATAQKTLPFTGLSLPLGVAVDAAGNVYVTDTGSKQVVELPAGATKSSQQKTLPFTGLSFPAGVVVGGSGTVYVSDANNDQVVELPAGATSSSQQKTLPFTGLSGPEGIAVDAAGDLFVADRGNKRIVELPAGATGSSQQVDLPFTGLSDPTWVAVDATGALYAVDPGTTRVVALTGYEPTTTTINWVKRPVLIAGQELSVKVTVAGAPPADGAVFSAKPGGKVTVSDGIGHTCTMTLAGGTGTCQLTEKAGQYQLTASYAGLGAFQASVSGITKITVHPAAAQAALTTRLSCPGSVAVGGTGTCQLTVKNGGPAAAASVTAEIALPPSLAETSCSRGCAPLDELTTWTYPRLAGNASVTQSVTFTARRAGRTRVVGEVSSLTPSPDLRTRSTYAQIVVSG
jgi:sugar lactone lactonase YvrE